MLPDFRNTDLLVRALTHTSFANENAGVEHNERLEFLGDAVLGFISAEWLFRSFPDLGEGRLTTVRSALIRAPMLAAWADEIGLSDHLRLGKGEVDRGGRRRSNILADAFEAVLGALYLDQGVDAVRGWLTPFLERTANTVLSDNLDRDPKTRLQEWSQTAMSLTPQYRLAATAGPPHDKTFTVELWLGERMVATGEGQSKQLAEQQAARAAWADLATLVPAPDAAEGAAESSPPAG